MRALISLTICGLVACGGANKPAQEPTQSSSSSEETPKWDSSSETADTSRRSKELTASAKSDDSSSNASETSAPSAPPSAPPKQRRSDEYDKEATEVVLKRAARQVKSNCGSATDEDGKASGPWGTSSMKLVLGHNGHLKEATIGPPYEGKPAGRCAVQAFSRLTYPPWAGSDMNLDWPIEFVHPGAAEKKK